MNKITRSIDYDNKSFEELCEYRLTPTHMGRDAKELIEQLKAIHRNKYEY